MLKLARIFIALSMATLSFSLSGCHYFGQAATTDGAISPTQNVQTLTQGDKVRMILPVDELFEFNSAQLKDSAYPILDNVADTLKHYPNTAIFIAGYSDNVGANNMASQNTAKFLSKQRAQSVLTYLWSRNINAQHMYAVGYGDKQNIAFNDNSAGNAANRRIEITLRVGCP